MSGSFIYSMNSKKCFEILALALIVNSCYNYEQLQPVEGNANHTSREDTPYTEAEINTALYIPGSAIVKFTPEMADAIEAGQSNPLSGISGELGLKHFTRLFPHAGKYEKRTRKAGLHQFYTVDFDTSLPLTEAQRLLESVESVENFEKCPRVKMCDATNDSGYSYLWEYTGDYSIHVEEAWKYTTGDPSVIVCVVDGGVEQDHPDLLWNLGSDNYNFVKNNTSIVGEDHGTHVAGTIAAVRNNGKGLAGIAGGDYAKKLKGTTIINAQVFQGKSSAGSFESAIKWGADHGAVISQNSWGYDYDFNGDGELTGYELDYALSATIGESMAKAIDYFIENAGCDENGNQLPDSPMKGGVVTFAAGNDGIQNGVPSNYAPVISVGATGRYGRLSTFSNYGDWVDICAPGEYIYSSITSGTYARLDGTSMACPHVSGALALLVAQFGKEGFTNSDLTEILLGGANPSLINCYGRAMGPYLDIEGAIKYGLEKYGRENNNPPVIETAYTGDYIFRQWENVSIPFRITDTDGDAPSITYETDGRGRFNRSATDPSTYYFELTCELVNDFAPKKAKIVATDVYGGMDEFEFSYQVMENQAPTLAKAIEDMLIPASGQLSASLEGVFEDPDGEKLTYSASVSPAGVAEVSVNGGTVSIKKLNNGLATVTVSARDYMGASASTTFKVLSRDENYPVDYYPNPVKDYLNIRISSLEPKDVRVRISPVGGSVVLDETIACSAFNPGKVDMRAFAPGQYQLWLNIGEIENKYTIVRR